MLELWKERPDIERTHDVKSVVSRSKSYIWKWKLSELEYDSPRMTHLFPCSGLLACSALSFFVWCAVFASLTNSRSSFYASPFGETETQNSARED